MTSQLTATRTLPDNLCAVTEFHGERDNLCPSLDSPHAVVVHPGIVPLASWDRTPPVTPTPAPPAATIAADTPSTASPPTTSPPNVLTHSSLLARDTLCREIVQASGDYLRVAFRGQFVGSVSLIRVKQLQHEIAISHEDQVGGGGVVSHTDCIVTQRWPWPTMGIPLTKLQAPMSLLHELICCSIPICGNQVDPKPTRSPMPYAMRFRRAIPDADITAAIRQVGKTAFQAGG
jgi:hypothetical protein